MLLTTKQTPQNRSNDRTLNCLVHTLQRPMSVLGKWVALNYIYTSFVCIAGLVSTLGQIMHSPSTHALSHPWLLLHSPRALEPHNAHKNGIQILVACTMCCRDFHSILQDYINLTSCLTISLTSCLAIMADTFTAMQLHYAITLTSKAQEWTFFWPPKEPGKFALTAN